MNSQSLARGLAYFSFGLGLAELLAPRRVARAIGVDERHENLLRLMGLREIGAGMGILQGNSATFVWSRVAGDIMDLGFLGAACRAGARDRRRVQGAMIAVAGVTVLDVIGGLLLSRNPSEPEWRVSRQDPGPRALVQRRDPMALREYAESTMAHHQSGHLRQGYEDELRRPNSGWRVPSRRRMQRREDAAIRQFEPGD